MLNVGTNSSDKFLQKGLLAISSIDKLVNANYSENSEKRVHNFIKNNLELKW